MPAQLLLAYRESRSTLRVIADAGADYGEGTMTIWMPVEPEANELLSRSPLALVIALLLDQQVTLEKAFAGEGTRLSVADITDPESLGEVRSYKQALKAAAKAKASAST